MRQNKTDYNSCLVDCFINITKLQENVSSIFKDISESLNSLSSGDDKDSYSTGVMTTLLNKMKDNNDYLYNFEKNYVKSNDENINTFVNDYLIKSREINNSIILMIIEFKTIIQTFDKQLNNEVLTLNNQITAHLKEFIEKEFVNQTKEIV